MSLFIRTATGVLTTLLLLGSQGCVIVTDVTATDWNLGADYSVREQSFQNVERVEFEAAGTLYIVQGSSERLKLEGHKQALAQLNVEEREGMLRITQSGKDYPWFELSQTAREPVYTLEMPTLQSLRHRGHGTVKVGPMTAARLQIESRDHAETIFASINAREVFIFAHDHADIQVQTLDSDALEVMSTDQSDLFIADASLLDADMQARDQSEVWIEGKADSVALRIADHSDIGAAHFATAVARVRASDHAQAQLYVSDSAQVEEADHADIGISGNATVTHNP
ncbi:MAG: DUF2807 domain-containing protein [Pseudomonadota bacterium]